MRLRAERRAGRVHADVPPVPVPNVIVFQYNPETHDARLDPARAGLQRRDRDEQPAGGARACRARRSPSRWRWTRATTSPTASPPSAAHRSGRAGSTAASPRSRCCSTPRGPRKQRCRARCRRPSVAALSGASIGPPGDGVPQSVMPVTLFIWGPGRIVPVRVTELTITEKLYDRALNPTHAEAQLSLRVLTPAELVAASADEDVLANLATIAYTYTLTLRQALAVANLANARASRSSGCSYRAEDACSLPTAATWTSPLTPSRCRTVHRSRRWCPRCRIQLLSLGYHRSAASGAARPRRRRVPERAERLLAAVRREQLDGRRRPQRPRADRHPGRGLGVSVEIQLRRGRDPAARRVLRRDRAWRSRRARTSPAR